MNISNRIISVGNELTLSGASTLTGRAAAAASDLTVSPRPVSVKLIKKLNSNQ